MTQNAKASAGFGALYRKNRHLSRLIVMMLAWMVFIALTKFQKFYTLRNFQTMAAQFPEYGLMSLGIMLCMITGGIDLSVVGVANVSSILMAFVLKRLTGAEGELPAYAIPLVFALAVGIGAVSGAFNGVLVSRASIPPILATLGTSELLKGISVVMTNGKAVSSLPMRYAEALTAKAFGVIPVQVIIFAVMAVLIWFLLNRTSYGTKIYLLGTSERAAAFSGLNNSALLVKTYMISGVCAALGGMIMLANYNSARADYGEVYTLQCVLIVVLGGISPTGGSGRISGVVLAIFLLRMLETGINRFPKISSYYISLIWGAVLILVMVLDYFTEHRVALRLRKS